MSRITIDQLTNDILSEVESSFSKTASVAAPEFSTDIGSKLHKVAQLLRASADRPDEEITYDDINKFYGMG